MVRNALGGGEAVDDATNGHPRCCGVSKHLRANVKRRGEALQAAARGARATAVALEGAHWEYRNTGFSLEQI
jgi:hypothetical protein